MAFDFICKLPTAISMISRSMMGFEGVGDNVCPKIIHSCIRINPEKLLK